MGFLIKAATSRGKTDGPALDNIYNQYMLDLLRDPQDPVDMTYFTSVPHFNLGPKVEQQQKLKDLIIAGNRVPRHESDSRLSAAAEEALQKGVSPRAAIPGVIGSYVDERALSRASHRDAANRAAARYVMAQHAADSVKLPQAPSWKSPLSYWEDSQNYNAAREKKNALQSKANVAAEEERAYRGWQDSITNDPVLRRMAAEAQYQKNSPILRDAQIRHDIKQSQK